MVFTGRIFCFQIKLHIQITAEDFQRAVNAFDVAALVAVAGVDTCADEAVADAETGTAKLIVSAPNLEPVTVEFTVK